MRPMPGPLGERFVQQLPRLPRRHRVRCRPAVPDAARRRRHLELRRVRPTELGGRGQGQASTGWSDSTTLFSHVNDTLDHILTALL